ncbi:hypothetical protein [Marinovum sp.]|uniref:hypothetical protein n=1 Tax=Marinovum sp. TaxID=2024839 RepID=UPI002B2759F4|nr:hypothetical protein [Marinovum sp.]
MLEMLMLLGTGLAAAGLAGMSGIGSQSRVAMAEPAAAATGDYHLGEDYEGGEKEDLLSQVRRMGEALDIARLVPSFSGPAAAETAPEAETVGVARHVEPAEAGHAELAPVDPQEDAVDLDALMTTLDDDAAGSEDFHAGYPLAEEAATEDDDVPVITDFASGDEQVLLMLPEGMAQNTTVSIKPAGAQGRDAAVVLEDAQGRLTAVIVAGAFGSLRAADVVVERAA